MAEGELGVETVGYRGQPQLRKLIAFCHRELGVTQILVRIPSPQLQRTPESGKRELGCAGQQRRPRLPDKLFEKCRVQGRRVDTQAVPRRHRDQNLPPRWRTVQLQQSTQPGNVASQRFLRRRRRGRSPHPVHQARHRDKPVTLGQQQAKECPLPRASQRQRLTVPADLQRPQYPEPQAGRGTADDLANGLTRWSHQPASTLTDHVGYPLRQRSPARAARRRRLVVRACCVDEVRCLRGRPDMIKRCAGVPPVHRFQPPSSRDSASSPANTRSWPSTLRVPASGPDPTAAGWRPDCHRSPDRKASTAQRGSVPGMQTRRTPTATATNSVSMPTPVYG